MTILDPPSATRRRLKVGLAIGGFLAGATFGLILTRLGKLITDAPPATMSNFLWNAAAFGIAAAVISPVVSWSALRRVPLWRTIVEPLALAVAGGTAALLVGVPILILALPPAGLALGFVHLHRRYPDPQGRLSSPLPNEEL